MKQDAILKINRMGRIGTVVTTIAKIFIIMGLVIVFALTIAAAFIPKDFLRVRADSKMAVNISLLSIGKSFTDEELEECRTETEKILEEEDAASGGSEYSINAINADHDNISIDLTGEYANFDLHGLVWVMLFLLLYLTMTLVTLFFVGFLCKAFQTCESPFEENVIKRIKMLACSLIPWTILSTVNDAVTSSFFTDSFHTDGIGIDGKMLMTVLIIFALAYIFQYGAILQQESDETL